MFILVASLCIIEKPCDSSPEKRAFSKEINSVLRVEKEIIVVELLIHFFNIHPFLLVLGREDSF